MTIRCGSLTTICAGCMKKVYSIRTPQFVLFDIDTRCLQLMGSRKEKTLLPLSGAWIFLNGLWAEREQVETEAFFCKKGDAIYVNMGISPENVSVKVGIIKLDGNKTYIWGKESNVAHEFSVSSSGSYKVFVENGTGTTVKIVGDSYRVC